MRFHSPKALGAPDAIFEDDLQAGVDVTLLYEPGTVAARLGVRRRVLVSILRGTLDKQLIGKTIGAATTARQFRLDGGQALLLTGAPHIVVIFRQREHDRDDVHAARRQHAPVAAPGAARARRGRICPRPG